MRTEFNVQCGDCGDIFKVHKDSREFLALDTSKSDTEQCQLPTTKVAGLQLPDVVPTSSGDSPPIVPPNTSVLEKGVASRIIPEAKRSGIAGALTGAQR